MTSSAITGNTSGIATATTPGLYKAGQAPGNTAGTAIASGFVGEIKTAYPASNIVPAASTTFKEITSVSLTPGIWLISAGVSLFSTTSTFTRLGVALSISPGTSASIGPVDDVLNNNYLQQTANTPNTQINVGPKYLVVTSTTTIYLNGRLDYTVLGDAAFNVRSGIQAVRIA